MIDLARAIGLVVQVVVILCLFLAAAVGWGGNIHPRERHLIETRKIKYLMWAIIFEIVAVTIFIVVMRGGIG